MVLLSPPTTGREILRWGCLSIGECAVAYFAWNIDADDKFISFRPHSFSCIAAVDIGKLTGLSFLVSVITQFFLVFAILSVHQKRRKARFLWRTGASNVNPEGRYHGVPEILFACQAILGVCVCGSVFLKSLHVLWSRYALVRHCIHRRVQATFIVSIFCSSILAAFYGKTAYDSGTVALTHMDSSRLAVKLE